MKTKSLLFLLMVMFLITAHSFAQEPIGPQTKITLDFKDAEIAGVLRSLSYSYDLNLVVTKDIEGKVTVSLKDVTIDEALRAILSVSGYGFYRKGNIIYVTPGPGIENMDLATETLSLNYLTASEASILLEKTISEKGDIRINQATNSIVVTDYPEFIAKAKAVLKDIDTAPIQVLIEAKLIDITDKDRLNLGTTISVDYSPSGTIEGSLKAASGSQNLAGPSASLSGGQFSVTSLQFSEISGSATVDALIQKNKAHLLASPSIATINNKEARIIIGERFPYKEKTQTTTGTTETTKFVDIGTTLRVTPQVSPDGWITMIVHPEVSSLVEELDAGPRITTREADATIRVKDGQTIVIGGLIKRQEDKIHNGIPFLKDIPVVGLLFSNRSTDVSVTELMVFITPHIISSPDGFKKIQDKKSDEVLIDINRTARRALVSELWNQANDLERGKGTTSVSKSKYGRLEAAYDNYMKIYKEYPDSDRADDALFSAGNIAYITMKELKLAKGLYTKILEEYPNSKFGYRAKRKIKSINRKLKD